LGCNCMKGSTRARKEEKETFLRKSQSHQGTNPVVLQDEARENEKSGSTETRPENDGISTSKTKARKVYPKESRLSRRHIKPGEGGRGKSPNVPEGLGIPSSAKMSGSAIIIAAKAAKPVPKGSRRGKIVRERVISTSQGVAKKSRSHIAIERLRSTHFASDQDTIKAMTALQKNHSRPKAK